jgi:hypothetical protein
VWAQLFQRDKLAGAGGPDPGVSVRNFLTRWCVLAEVMSYVFGGHFDGDEFQAVVHCDGEPDKFGKDDHVAVVGADDELPAVFGRLLRLFELAKELLLSAGHPPFEAAALAGRDQFHKLFHGHAFELIQVFTAVEKFMLRFRHY